MIHYVESISQRIRAASHSTIGLDVILEADLSHSDTREHLRSPVSHICPQKKKTLNSVKGPLRVPRERRLSLTHMTAAASLHTCVVLTDVETEDLSGSAPQPAARFYKYFKKSQSGLYIL